ncbi:MAG: 4a-hydroxytetrahydrobiopterin dehydratase [Rhodocyclaceae bacterium]|nr:4a-hydroxytetrahydrobiopterin dehydratase [Rhodocyclaceae bacterium]MBX3669383.1 4a-hydroxytetrahydrobiopterin dehydratase [Rhodocyclaceae bacterium]
MALSPLAAERCRELSGPQHRAGVAECDAWLAELPGWQIADGRLRREFRFPNFDATMAFVNGVAWMAQAQNHHPDLAVSYAHVTVTYSTHSVGGLSRNDFICAAKIEALSAL